LVICSLHSHPAHFLIPLFTLLSISSILYPLLHSLSTHSTGGGTSYVRTAGHNKGTCLPFIFLPRTFLSTVTCHLLPLLLLFTVSYLFFAPTNLPPTSLPLHSSRLPLSSCFSLLTFSSPSILSSPSLLIFYHHFSSSISFFNHHSSSISFSFSHFHSPLLPFSHRSFPFLTALTGVPHRNHPQADRDPGTNARREIPVRTVRYIVLHTK
jgi:hypothetical protein